MVSNPVPYHHPSGLSRIIKFRMIGADVLHHRRLPGAGSLPTQHSGVRAPVPRAGRPLERARSGRCYVSYRFLGGFPLRGSSGDVRRARRVAGRRRGPSTGSEHPDVTTHRLPLGLVGQDASLRLARVAVGALATGLSRPAGPPADNGYTRRVWQWPRPLAPPWPRVSG